jgi:adenylylsulfate kinase
MQNTSTSTRGKVIWFTGMSGAGKSTICRELAAALRLRGELVQLLDGDEIRHGLCADLGFTHDDRMENIRRISCVAKLLSDIGVTVLVAAITPSQLHRDLARALVPTILEIFVDAPLSVCEQRDPKGLYKKARAGLLRDFTGIDAPYDPPLSPTFTCRTVLDTPEQSVYNILTMLDSHTRLPPSSSRKNTVAVDFDGVIAEYDGWTSRLEMGSPRADVVRALNALRDEGWKIIIHTTRSGDDITSYLLANDIPFDEINRNSDYDNLGPKPVATVYWDDRAVPYTGDAARDLIKIKRFVTWSGRR